MKYHILGSNGLIGKNLIGFLSCHYNFVETKNWSSKDPENYFCLNDENSWTSLLNECPENVLLLSWPGLPNYNSDHHVETNLVNLIRLINKLRDCGLKRVIALGTCYEYGKKNGMLSPNDLCDPSNKYGLAKYMLSVYLQYLASENKISYSWLRLFYIYSEEQKPNCLTPQLIRAIKRGDKEFSVGSETTQRDFISIDDALTYICEAMFNYKIQGIMNVGSGHPVSIKKFSEMIAKRYDSSIQITVNNEESRSYEPEAFWADMSNWDLTKN